MKKNYKILVNKCQFLNYGRLLSLLILKTLRSVNITNRLCV